MQVTDQPPRPVTPAPAALYPECDCGRDGGPNHVCPHRPDPQPEPEPTPDAGRALRRLEVWAAWVLNDRQRDETLTRELVAGGVA